MIRPEICQGCFQKDRCEMKDFAGPLSIPQVIDGKHWLEVIMPSDCWFYTCPAGHMEARHSMREARYMERTGLIEFGSNHKPATFQDQIKGRFVAYGMPNLPDGQIVIVYHGQIVKLTHIDYPPPH